MLAKERQAKIKELIKARKNLKMSELSQMLSVSEMTIHRDVKALVEEGLVIKTFGGITLANKESNSYQTSGSECVFCHRPLHDRFSYRLILSGNKVESACCCHCGLLRQAQLGGDVVQAICYDFLTHTTISALSAWFVMETAIDIRCCQPQVLPFDSKEHAESFVKGFGGTVVSMKEAMERVLSLMKQDSDNRCQHN
jgi:DNA-binding MarR family transcriptional regulator